VSGASRCTDAGSSAGCASSSRCGRGAAGNGCTGSRSVGEESRRLIGCAAGARGDTGNIWDGGDGTEGLSGLNVCDSGTSGIGIDSWEVLVITEAAQEGTINVGSGGIVLATDTIEDVLAVVGGVGTCGVASLEAESSSTHDVVPFDGLDEVTGEGLGEQEGTEGVTTLISTVRVELSSRVGGVEVDELLVDEASDLDIVGGLHELQTGDGTLGDDTSTIAGLCAPGNVFTFGVTDERVWLRGTPEAEIINAVDDGGLAQRSWSFGGAVAQVVSSLGTTFTVSSICLVGQSGIGEVLRSKRDISRGCLSKGHRHKRGDEGDGGEDGRHFVEIRLK